MITHSILDLGNTQDEDEITENFQWRNHGDIIRRIGPEDRYISFKNKQGEKIKISLLDLENIGNLSDDEISEMLREILGITIQSSKGIELVNELAKRSLKYLKEELFYTDQELRGLGNIHFNTSKDIIDFFKGTRKAQGLKKCMLAKVGMLFQEGIGHHVEEKRKKTVDVLEKKVIRNLEDIAKSSSLGLEIDGIMEDFSQTGKTTFTGSIFAEGVPGEGKKIMFQVEVREKSLESTISKALREKDYINQGDIMDLLGIRITTKNKEDKLILMNLISQLAFKYGEYRIKNKFGITENDLEILLQESEYFKNNSSISLFIKRLEESFSKVEKRASTALKYSDIKLVPVGEGNKLSFEILFLDEGHTNNIGLAHHMPFMYRRKIGERIRLEGYIKKEGVIKLSCLLVEDISKSSRNSLGGVSPTELMKQILKDIYDEIPDKIGTFSLKDYTSIESMKKQELEYELKRVLPKYYISKLIPFKDSKGNTSKKSKYTNKVGFDNLSVLGDN
ncbi:hypothetical protein LAT59_00440 [Candidatus Gracilibacteria bacterium]|nr:hypothetical protein [Candidatus Gracilibacteria bacterium]